MSERIQKEEIIVFYPKTKYFDLSKTHKSNSLKTVAFSLFEYYNQINK